MNHFLNSFEKNPDLFGEIIETFGFIQRFDEFDKDFTNDTVPAIDKSEKSFTEQLDEVKEKSFAKLDEAKDKVQEA